MAVTVVTAGTTPILGTPAGAGTASVLQSPAGATGDTTFVITMPKTYGGMRGRTLEILNVGTAFAAGTTFSTSVDGTNYQSLKLLDNATSGLPIAATPIVTGANLSVFVCAHDFNFLKIVTTVGDATSGFKINVGN